MAFTGYTHLKALKVGDPGSEVSAVEDDGTLYQKGTEVTATASELNALDQSVNGALMSPGSGLTAATGFVYKVGIERHGDIITTRIYMDLTGLNSGGAAGDIIGNDGGAANCHFGQITAANNGTIKQGWIDVAEAPAGGDPDINLFSGDEATGAENAAASGLTNSTQLTDSGDLAVGTRVYFTEGLPAADQYLYLVVGTQTDADYTAGQIVVTLVGVDLS
jgi:hypothetical protein